MNRKDNNLAYQQSTYDIYVANVPKDVNETELKHLFQQFGDVKQVLCRRKDDHIGYAIAKFMHKLDAERLLFETNEVDWNGHVMPIKAARRSDHGAQNGNGMTENKQTPCPEMNKNQYLPLTQHSNTDFGYFHHSSYTEDKSAFSKPMMLEVLCTNVEDAITFYGCPVNRSDELALLISALNRLNFHHKRIDFQPCTNRVYAALFSEDQTWYRCTVIQNVLPNFPGMCNVRYIDYGNQEVINYRNIVELPESLQKIQPFASKFVFSNLVIEPKVPNKKSFLHQLVNKRMSLCAYLTLHNNDYQVIKCSCNGKDIIAETITKGFAKLNRTPKSDYPQSVNKSKAYAPNPESRFKNYNNGNPVTRTAQVQSGMNGIPSNRLKRPPESTIVSCYNEEENNNGTSVEDPKKETDFHPKMIIKRGSDLGSDVVKCNGTYNRPKETTIQPSLTSMIDGVIPNLKLINNIRGLVSQSCDDSIINRAVDLLKEEISTTELTENSKKCIGDAYEEYSEALNKIRLCSEKCNGVFVLALLPSLKLERDLRRNSLCSKLKDYLESYDSSIFERKVQIMKTITDLESNSNAWMNVQLDQKPENLDELITKYKKVKDDRWDMVSKTRENTNQKHKQFMDLFITLQKEFYLNVLDDEKEETDDVNPSACNNIKSRSYSEKWNESLKELGKALEEEIHMLTLNKDTTSISVIQYLLDVLDVHKEKVDAVCELYQSRYVMYNELNKVPDVLTFLTELTSIEEELQNLEVQLSEYTNIPKEEGTLPSEVNDLLKQIHQVVLKEDSIKASLSKAAETYFPELNIEHEERKLLDYCKHGFLLKTWKLDYFPNLGPGDRGDSSFLSQFLEEPVVIKEYLFENSGETENFIQTAVLWNKTNSDLLVKIKGIIMKDETTVCILFPCAANVLFQCSLPPSPQEGENACRILRQVLNGLRDIHAQGLVHCHMHPATVIVENNKAILDFCYDTKYLTGKTSMKGINFLPPENKVTHESGDMYGFGCLVLWVLFPNLSFTATADGVPNIAAFRSIIEELILPKDYSFLFALVDASPERRPTSSTLLSKGFLSKYESYCRSRCDIQKKA